MKQPKIEVVPIQKLIPYVSNSRTHSEDQIAEIAGSIREFGFTNPVLIGNDDTIYAGHGRVMAARKLGMESVPCIRLGHLTSIQAKAYVIADNKLALNAGWDEKTLKAELELLKTEDFNIDLLGFSDEELNLLLNNEKVEGNTDPDEIPAPPADPITKPGDLWILGNHKLLCGDSTSIDSVNRLMGGEQANLLLTDPPYNVAYEGKTDDALTIQNDSMDNDSFAQFLRDVYSTADTVMKEGAVFYIWHADKEGLNFRKAAFEVGWKIRQCLIWNKNTLVLGMQDYHCKHEPCLYGWKDGASHFWGSDRTQTTVLDFNKPRKNGEHPTMKPVELFEYQIGNSSKPNDVVLDLFGGSGTTIIACERIGRKARLMELDPRYCDVIVKRWEEFSGKKAVLESLKQ